MLTSTIPRVNRKNPAFFRRLHRQGQAWERSLLADLFRETAALIGEELVHAILHNLAKALQVNHVILSETLGQHQIRARQFNSRDQNVADLEYAATESPCEWIIERKPCCYPTGAQSLLPKHPFVRKFGAEGYIGVPLFTSDSNLTGVLMVLHDAPLQEPDTALSVCILLALRIGAELERMRTEQNLRQSERYFRKVAFNDPLTGLPNRLLLMNRLGHAVERARRYGHCLAVLFLDIDGFKQVNDNAGHDIGDQVLTIVARRIAGCIRSGDTVARLGGDEFVILLEQCGNESQIRTVTEHALSSFFHPIEITGYCWSLSTSIGISTYDGSGPTIQALDLLKQADTAMYSAKQSGPGQYRFSSGRCVSGPSNLST